MRYYIVFIVILFISCKSDSKEEPGKVTNQPNFSFLVGKWQRIDDQEGRETFENWYSIDSDNFNGSSYTLEKNDTIFKEGLLIKMGNPTTANNPSWILQVSGVNESPTDFEIKKYDKDSFIAVNIQNDFPTHINYSISNDTLKAVISNRASTVNYTFIKQ